MNQPKIDNPPVTRLQTRAAARSMLDAPNRIKEWRTRRRMSLAELGEAVGLSRSEISKLENGSRRVRSDHLLAISKALRVRPEDLLAPSDARELLSRNDGDADRGRTRSAGMDLPVLGVPQAGEFIMDDDRPQTFVDRPGQLARVTNAYGFHMPSTRLEPHVRVGTLLYVNPLMPPRPEDIALVRYTDNRADVVLVVRDAVDGRLLGRKFNPAENVELVGERVKMIHRVVGCWFS